MPIDGEIGPIYLPSASAASVYFSRYILHGRPAYRTVPLSLDVPRAESMGIWLSSGSHTISS